jgi:hypothetical protein
VKFGTTWCYNPENSAPQFHYFYMLISASCPPIKLIFSSFIHTKTGPVLHPLCAWVFNTTVFVRLHVGHKHTTSCLRTRRYLRVSGFISKTSHCSLFLTLSVSVTVTNYLRRSHELCSTALRNITSGLVLS